MCAIGMNTVKQNPKQTEPNKSNMFSAYGSSDNPISRVQFVVHAPHTLPPTKGVRNEYKSTNARERKDYKQPQRAYVGAQVHQIMYRNQH